MAQEHAQAGAVVKLHELGGDKTTALVKADQFEAIRICVSPEKPIAPHKVDGPITVQCLSGKCTFFIGSDPRHLEPGDWLYLTGGTIHALEAAEPSTLLVTILFAKS